MTSNRFIERSAVTDALFPRTDLRQWCSDQNRRSHLINRWYWVQDVQIDGHTRSQTQVAEGLDAHEIHELLGGVEPSYMNWPSEKMRGHVRMLRNLMRRGLTEQEYTQWTEQVRGGRAAA